MRIPTLPALAFLSACGADLTTPPEASREIPAPFVPADDVELVDVIAHHHAVAVELADEVLARGADEAVGELARALAERQRDELDALQALRATLTSAPTTPRADDPHEGAAMARIGSLTGTGLDLAFLEEMIPLHGDALAVVHRALPGVGSAELGELAEEVVAAQAREIGEMRAALDRHAGD